VEREAYLADSPDQRDRMRVAACLGRAKVTHPSHHGGRCARVRSKALARLV